VGAIGAVLVLAVTGIGRYYKITVPRGVGKLLGIGENVEVEWVFEDGKVFIGKRGGDHG